MASPEKAKLVAEIDKAKAEQLTREGQELREEYGKRVRQMQAGVKCEECERLRVENERLDAQLAVRDVREMVIPENAKLLGEVKRLRKVIDELRGELYEWLNVGSSVELAHRSRRILRKTRDK
jgi:hypothetical protein